MDINTIIPIITGALAVAGALLLHRQRTTTERSELASQQYASASKMVEQYVDDLHDLSERVSKLQLGLLEANEELAALRLENSQFRQQIADLQSENQHLQQQVTELLAENERLRQ